MKNAVILLKYIDTSLYFFFLSILEQNIFNSSRVGSPSLSLRFMTWIAPIAFPLFIQVFNSSPSKIPLNTPQQIHLRHPPCLRLSLPGILR